MQAARETYRHYFDTVVVGKDDDELRDAVFRLRYQVYCIENPFEDPADNPDGRERDAYDERAAHCLLLHLPSNTWAGAARLILPDPSAPKQSFALQQVCFDPIIGDPDRFPVMKMGEVSRFCISKHFRRRAGDMLFPQSNDPKSGQDPRRVVPNMTLGLIEGLVQISLDKNIWYWCAVMEPALPSQARHDADAGTRRTPGCLGYPDRRIASLGPSRAGPRAPRQVMSLDRRARGLAAQSGQFQ